jgi:hypothetical protein
MEAITDPSGINIIVPTTPGAPLANVVKFPTVVAGVTVAGDVRSVDAAVASVLGSL